MSVNITSISRTILTVAEFAPIIAFGYFGSCTGLNIHSRLLIIGGLALVVLAAYRITEWPMKSRAISANVFLLIERGVFIMISTAMANGSGRA